MDKIDIAGLQLNPITKDVLLQELDKRIANHGKTFVTTLYSEFLYRSLHDTTIRNLLNSADIAVADGISMLWAQYYLSRPFNVKSYWGKVLLAWWQVVYTGASILLSPKVLYRTIPEKIVGADLMWDLTQLANNKNYTIYLVGWFDQQTEKVKSVLEQKYPGIKIVGYANTTPDSTDVISDIQRVQPDIVLVAFGILKQERWIAAHIYNLPVKLCIGLGGSFDYVIGKVSVPPQFIRDAGLEWLYRLITQAHRVKDTQRAKRIYYSVWGLIVSLVRYKVYESYEYRKNVVAVVVNPENKILLCQSVGYPNKNALSWQFPQGGVHDGEDIVIAAQRELHEETNMSSVSYMGTAKLVNKYRWNNATRPLGGYRACGQMQHTVFFKFHGPAQEIKLDNRELVKYEWLTFDQVLERMVPERVPHATAVFAELKGLLST